MRFATLLRELEDYYEKRYSGPQLKHFARHSGRAESLGCERVLHRLIDTRHSKPVVSDFVACLAALESERADEIRESERFEEDPNKPPECPLCDDTGQVKTGVREGREFWERCKCRDDS